MTLHQETITDAMRAVARVVFENLDPEYYLAGETSLALCLCHRKSVDLDYFIAKPIDTLVLKNKLSEIFSKTTVKILFETKDTLWCVIDGVKVSFISRFDTLLELPKPVDSFRLANIKDITVMKLVAICGREEYKDYFDLACLEKETDVRSWISWWQDVYPEQGIMSWVVALSAVDSIPKIPLEISEDFKNKNVEGALKSVVEEVTRQVNLTSGA